MTSRPLPAGRAGGDVATYLSSESELRIRSYFVFHRIYEAMALGMHPTILHPRRNQIAPFFEVTYKGLNRVASVAPLYDCPYEAVKYLYPLKLWQLWA